MPASKTTAAKADAIAHATKKVITEKMEEDPAFYEKFSKLIQEAIDAFRAKRISDLEYLNRVTEIKHKIVKREHDDVPEAIKGNENAMAYYGILKRLLISSGDGHPVEQLAVESANAIIAILDRNQKSELLG